MNRERENNKMLTIFFKNNHIFVWNIHLKITSQNYLHFKLLLLEIKQLVYKRYKRNEFVDPKTRFEFLFMLKMLNEKCFIKNENFERHHLIWRSIFAITKSANSLNSYLLYAWLCRFNASIVIFHVFAKHVVCWNGRETGNGDSNSIRQRSHWHAEFFVLFLNLTKKAKIN